MAYLTLGHVSQKADVLPERPAHRAIFHALHTASMTVELASVAEYARIVSMRLTIARSMDVTNMKVQERMEVEENTTKGHVYACVQGRISGTRLMLDPD